MNAVYKSAGLFLFAPLSKFGSVSLLFGGGVFHIFHTRILG